MPTRGRGHLPPLSATTAASLLVGLDSISILGTGYGAYFLIVQYPAQPSSLYSSAILFVWVVSMMLMHFAELYRFEAAIRPAKALPVIAVAVGTTFLFLLAAAFSVKLSATYSRLWLGAFALSSGAAVMLVRLFFSAIISRAIGYRGFNRNVAIVGVGKQAHMFIERLQHDHDRPLLVCGVFSDEATAKSAGAALAQPYGIELAGAMDDLIATIRKGTLDDVIIALPWSEDERIMQAVRQLQELPVNVYLASDAVGFRVQMNPPPGHFGGLPVHQLLGKPLSGWDAVLKALEDYVLSSLLILALSPLLLVIAVAIKLDTPGPIMFRQKRLGFNNEVFDVYKFRSMRVEAVAQVKTIQAQPNDPRITRLGKFLRRWSLDELPQLLNVLNGSMSLVGPRPHALDHNEDFAKAIRGYFARHRVKPGITGLAQIRGYRGATDTAEKLEGRIRNDIAYTENWSLWLDFDILMRTLVVCVSGKNAY